VSRTLETLKRVASWQLGQEEQALAAVRQRIAALEDEAARLEIRIAAEQTCAAADPVGSIGAYSVFARVAIGRRDHLAAALAAATKEEAVIRERLMEAYREQKKIEMLIEAEGERLRREDRHRQQAAADEAALGRHRGRR
jgi:flagellar export protein FliJ